ncbi:hypothetical protein B0H14DRAFT_2585656 [Mycena olivaceomarginata]|nr:hypothetical protein B0H14DRAFT_2585656 [Mycena olivaceomarginata]
MPPSKLGYRKGTENTLNQTPPEDPSIFGGPIYWSLNCVVQTLKKATQLPKEVDGEYEPEDLEKIARELSAIRFRGGAKTAQNVLDKLKEVKKIYQNTILPLLAAAPDYSAEEGTKMGDADWDELVARNESYREFKKGWALLPYAEKLFATAVVNTSHHPGHPLISQTASIDSSVDAVGSVGSLSAVGSVNSPSTVSHVISPSAGSSALSSSVIDTTGPESSIVGHTTRDTSVSISGNGPPSTPPRDHPAMAGDAPEVFRLTTPVRTELQRKVNLMKNHVQVQVTPRSLTLLTTIATANQGSAPPPVASRTVKSAAGKKRESQLSLTSKETSSLDASSLIPYKMDDMEALIMGSNKRANWDERVSQILDPLLRGIEAGTEEDCATQFPTKEGPIMSIIDFAHERMMFEKDIAIQQLVDHTFTLKQISMATIGWRVLEHIILTVERLQYTIAFEVDNKTKNMINIQIFLRDPRFCKREEVTQLKVIDPTSPTGKERTAIQKLQAWKTFSDAREVETSKLRFMLGLYSLFGSMVLLLPTVDPENLPRPQVKNYQQRLGGLSNKAKNDADFRQKLISSDQSARQNILHILAAVAPPQDKPALMDYLNTFWIKNPCKFEFATE